MKLYLISTGHSLILLNLSEAYQLPPFDSGIVNNTPFCDEIVASKSFNKKLTI